MLCTYFLHLTGIYDNEDFDSKQRNSRCFVYANVKEEGIGITVALCADDIRKRHVYTSSTNKVEILVTVDEGKDASRFILNFEGAWQVYSVETMK